MMSRPDSPQNRANGSMSGKTDTLFCQIADLTVTIPAAGGLAPRCREYMTDRQSVPDIVICEGEYRTDRWPKEEFDTACYMESARVFYGKLLQFDGFYLHASAVEYEGRAYLFSGPSTVGKSTHTSLWQTLLGQQAQVFNDDKTALRYVDNRWFAYGTPWCGKDGINQNKKVPLAGICFLKQAKENHIRRLSSVEAVSCILWQTIHKLSRKEDMEMLLSHIDQIVRTIPVYELECLPNVAAAQLSIDTMTGNPT
jgi:hypothetical protein